MTEERKPEFRPLGGQESTEEAEVEGHDLGTRSSEGEPQEAIGSLENVSNEEGEAYQHSGFDRGA
jgi:hypothetical protein